jgi:hypothetical protein
MKDHTVMTVSRELPQDLQRRILRCAVTAVRDAGATHVATSITDSQLVVEAELPD